ncbi:MAG TPA: carboxypeptidase-like regulatory domain-containing protein, partial [Planctomycetota bacterium]|nr:carboxypeptidase-like regulatory domain-containing protein [Planctomycetota bacterium]
MLLGGGVLLPGVILLFCLWLRSPAPVGAPPNAAPLPGPESAPAASLEAAPSPPDAAPGVPHEGAAAEVEGSISLAGRLVDGPSSVPLAFADARALLHGGARLRPLAITTDAAGRFTLRHIEPGTYVLETRHTAYLPARNGVEVPARAAPGGDLEQTIPEVEVTLFPGASLEGEVVTGAGAPIEGARVRLLLLGEGGPDGAAARTDAHGRFTLRSLESGTWRVLAGAAGFRRASTEVEVPEEEWIRIVLGEDAGLFVAVMGA